jgi:hypothetical protein
VIYSAKSLKRRRAMEHESTTGLESDFLEKVWASNTTIRTKITTVRLEKTGASTIEIRPRDIGTDKEGWSVGESQIPVQTLKEAIIVGMEIQARQ